MSCQDFLKSHTAPPPVSHGSPMIYRTLLDIIHDEEPNGSFLGHKDKKSWKAFKNCLRLKRVGVAWTSTVLIPASDIPIHSTNNGTHFTDHNFNYSRSLMSRRNSVHFTIVFWTPKITSLANIWFKILSSFFAANLELPAQKIKLQQITFKKKIQQQHNYI